MRTRLAAAAMAVLALAGACGTDDSDEGATTQSPATTAQPVRGGALVVAIDSDPGSLNPAVTSNGGVHTASEPMFNGLVGWGPDNKPAPELAASWTVGDGGSTYTFTLRDNAKWHDGRPVTSDDVKFSFEKALLPFHSRTKASMGSAGLKLEAPDPRTVVFRFNFPYAPLLQQLNVTEAPIIPRHVFESCADISTAAGCPANKAPVGSGPFKFVSYSPNEIRMARNPDYFRPGLPYPDELIERVIPQAGTRILALEAKEVDWVWTVDGQDAARLAANNAITVVAAPRSTGGGNCILQVAFNLKPPADRPPILTDLRVRQAFAAAVNRQQAADQILFGQGRVAAAPISSGIPFAHATGLNLPSYDPSRARSLLDAAGWKDEGRPVRVARGVANVADGTELNIDFFHFSGQQATYGEALKGQLREVGINLVTKQSDNATLSDNVFTKRTFDTAIVSYCNGDDPEIGVRRQYVTSQIGPTAFSNGAGYSNPEVDSLFDQAAREVDTAERSQLYRRIQEAAVRDLPYWWLAETDFARAHNAACTGFNVANTGLFAEGAFCKR